MVDGLDGLRHDIVVGSHDNDNDIGDLGTTGTHCGESFVTRSVEERDVLSVLEFHVVGTDVLGDTTSLTGDYVGVADIVEERRLTVIHVTHHGHYRWTRFEVFLRILLAVDSLYHLRAYKLGLESKFVGNEVDGLGIESLVD